MTPYTYIGSQKSTSSREQCFAAWKNRLKVETYFISFIPTFLFSFFSNFFFFLQVISESTFYCMKNCVSKADAFADLFLPFFCGWRKDGDGYYNGLRFLKKDLFCISSVFLRIAKVFQVDKIILSV